MPIIAPASDATGAFEQLQSQSGMGQVLYPPAQFPTPLPATIPGSGSWSSGTVFCDGYRILTVGILMTQAGSLVITPYLDSAATMVRTAFITTTSIVANTVLIVDLPTASAPGPTTTQGIMPPFGSFTITVNNSGATATITSFLAILSAG